MATAEPLEPGTRVRLVGLQSAAHLNGRVGLVMHSDDKEAKDAAARGRVGVVLYPKAGLSPSDSRPGRPETVAAQRANLEVLPPQAGGRVGELDVSDAQLSAAESLALARGDRAWAPCPVPEMLGVPLKLRRLGTPTFRSEQIQAYLQVSPAHGFAPPDVLAGCGAMHTARYDGEDISADDVMTLYDYMGHLMDAFPDFLEDPVGTRERKRRALSPAGLRRFCKSRGYAPIANQVGVVVLGGGGNGGDGGGAQQQEEEEEDDDDDDDSD